VKAASIGTWAREAVASAGYPGLAGLILAENLFPPLPSELFLPLAGYYVGTGELQFAGAVAAATLGSLLGALVIYAIGRHGGRPLLLRYGRFLRVGAADIDRAEGWFARWDGWIVFGGRLVPGVRSLVSVPAGLARMPLWRFALLTTLGSALWNAALIGAGWALGSNHGAVGDYIGPVSTVLIALLAGGAAVLCWYWLRRRRAA
jgi:membrane protein DedA with SNARE-associated domain